MLNQVKRSSFSILDIACIVAAIAALAYVVLRAVLVPPMGDEAVTFFSFIQTGDFLPFRPQPSANNHVLNSALSWIFYHLFGSSLFVLRVPNLLAFVLYLLYAWRFRSLFNSRYKAFFFFLALLASQYLISFFHLTRGYGISMAFLLAALYHLIQYWKAKKPINLYAGLGFISLAAWANLSIMLTGLIIGGLFILRFVKTRHNSPLKEQTWTLSGILFFYLLPFGLAVWWAIRLKQAGALYHTIHEKDTVVGNLLIEMTEYDRNAIYFYWALLGLYILSCFTLFKHRPGAVVMLTLVFWGTVAGTVLLHYVLGVNYPQGRAALHFLPLFLVGLFITLDQVRHSLSDLLCLVITASLLFHFFKDANLRYAPVAKDEAVPFSFYRTVNDWSKKTGRIPTIASHGIPALVFNFYDFRQGGNLNHAQGQNGAAHYADFQIINNWFHGTITDYHVLERDPGTGIALLQRNSPVEWDSLYTLYGNNSSGSPEFINLAVLKSDSFFNNAVAVDVSFKVRSDEKAFRWWLVLSVSENGKDYIYKFIDLQWVKFDLTHGETIRRRFFIDRFPSKTATLNVHIWNMRSKEIDISQPVVKIFTAK